MRDHAVQIAREAPPEQRVNRLREYLHHYLLRALHGTDTFGRMSFVGGTALRLVHGLPRFSEDMDFSAAARDFPGIRDVVGHLETQLPRAGYEARIVSKSERTVESCFVKFRGLLRDVGVTPDPGKLISIKIEVDTNPPEGAGIERTLVHVFFPVTLIHHDLPSLFAGKVHALLARSWVKGRDWYDLAWYLTKHPSLEPNFTMLENALRQQGKEYLPVTSGNWRGKIRDRMRELDFASLGREVEPFLESPEDLDHLTADLVMRKLGPE